MATLVVITEAKHVDAHTESPAVLIRSEEIMILESETSVKSKSTFTNYKFITNLEFLLEFPDSLAKFIVSLASRLSQLSANVSYIFRTNSMV
jgi:hypothetical protein